MMAKTSLAVVIGILVHVGPGLGMARGEQAAGGLPEPIELDPERDEYRELGHVQILADETGELGLEDVATSDGWRLMEEARPNYGFTDVAYWLRFRVRNESPRETRTVVRFHYALLDHVDAYVERADGTHRRFRVGDMQPFEDRPLHHVRIAFPIDSVAGQTQSIYVRVATDSSMQPGMDLVSYERFVGSATRFEALHGVYYGLMFVILLYNLFLYFAVRNTSYLLYVVFVTVFTATQMGLDGAHTRYLFPSWPEGAQLFTPLAVAFAQPTPVLFTMSFLNTKIMVPRAHKYLVGYVVATSFTIPLALLAPYEISIRIVAGLSMVTALVCEVVGIVVLRRGYRAARFYVLAWTALIVGTILYSGVVFGVVPSNAITINFQRIGSALEVTLLSFALGDRINLIEREREQARTEALALERDLALTAAVQQMFLPRRDTLEEDGVSLAGFYRPATQCGGDWWWYEQLADGRLFVLLGDVTGHGAGAAMMTAAIAAAYRSVPFDRRRDDVEDVFGALNRSFQDISGGEHHMALTAVEIDQRTRKVRLWSGGAPAIFIAHSDGEIEPLGARGRPLGDADMLLGQAEYDLRSGDRLFIFSDGLPELVKANGRQLGYRAITRMLSDTRDMAVDEARAKIATALDRKRGGQPQHDDVTFVLLDVTTEGRLRSVA